MAVTRMYVPAAGQADAKVRADTLGAGLSVAETANAPRYRAIGGQLPAVVLENGEQIVVLPEPTTLAVVDQAASDLEALTPPADIVPGTDQPQMSIAVDETSGLLTVTAAYADGTVKTGVVPLT